MPSLTTVDHHVTLARTYAEEVWNQGVLSRIDEIASDDVVCHDTSAGELEGAAKLGEFVAAARAAFPGLVYRVDEVSIDGDAIDLRWSATGDDQPRTSGPSEGRSTVSGRATLRIADGEITEIWSGFDPWR